MTMVMNRPTPLIDLAAPPFRGHLHPILGIARRLVAEGYGVRVLTTERGATQAGAVGLDAVAFLRGRDGEIDRIVGASAEATT